MIVSLCQRLQKHGFELTQRLGRWLLSACGLNRLAFRMRESGRWGYMLSLISLRVCG